MRLSNTQHHVGIARLLNAARLIEAPAGAATWRRRRRRLISCVCVLDAPLDTATGARWTAHAISIIVMCLLAPVAEENEGRGVSRGVFDCVWALGSPQKTQSMIRCAVRRGCQKSIEAATTESNSLPQQPLPLRPLPICSIFLSMKIFVSRGRQEGRQVQSYGNLLCPFSAYDGVEPAPKIEVKTKKARDRNRKWKIRRC